MAELAPKGTDRWRRTGRDETSVEDIKADQKNHVVGEVELQFVKREVREGDLLRVDRVARQPPEFSAVWAYTPLNGFDALYKNVNQCFCEGFSWAEGKFCLRDLDGNGSMDTGPERRGDLKWVAGDLPSADAGFHRA